LVNVLALGVAAVLACALIGSLGVFGACLALLIANLVRLVGGAIAIAWVIAGEGSRERASSGAVGGATQVDHALGVSSKQ